MRLLTLLLIPTLLLPGPQALGQTSADDEFARKHFKLGEEYHNRADYEKALGHFTTSFELSKKPALLFNMARCQELLGEHQKAIDLYNRFLKHDPPQAELVRQRVTNLTRLVERKKLKESQKEETAQPVPVPAPAPAPAPRPEPKAQPKPEPKAEPDPAPVAVKPSAVEPSRPMRLAGWSLVGVGAASLITGLVLGVLAADKASELEDLNAAGATEYARVTDEEDAGRSLQAGQIAALAVGGAAAAVGAVLLVLDARKAPDESRAWLTPSVGPGGAVVTAGVRF